jgi:hypothetical protein
MSSQTYQADDQLGQEHDQAVSGDDVMEPDGDLAEPGEDVTVAPLAEADADRALDGAALDGAALAEAPLAEPDADQTEHDLPTWHPADPDALADDESVDASVPDYLGVTSVAGHAGDEPGINGTSPASPSLVTAALAMPESVTESRFAGSIASADGPWNEIQAMFVDDPRASIEQAAAVVDDRAEALIQSVAQRQRSLKSAWQADDAGTEELRVALQQYRTFWNSLEGEAL